LNSLKFKVESLKLRADRGSVRKVQLYKEIGFKVQLHTEIGTQL